jgi:hypothetical protein
VVNTVVSVGADNTIPPTIKVSDASLRAGLAPAAVALNWTPATAYTAGQPVISPTGDVVTAKVAFTSGASYSAANWNLSTSYVLLSATGKAVVASGVDAGDGVNKGQLDASVLRHAPSAALAMTLDRRLITGTVVPALTSGTLRLSAVWIPKGTVVTNITYLCGTAATSLTNRWYSLFDGSRNLLRTTADNTSAWNAGSTLTLPLSSTYTVPADGLYYVGICEVATTPTATRGIASSTGAGIAISPVLNGDSTASLTNAASTPSTAGTITASGNIPFAYVS